MSLPAINMHTTPQGALCASIEESIQQEVNKPNITLDRESIQRQGEKQILVDPISLTPRLPAGNEYGYLHSYLLNAGPRMEVISIPPHDLIPPPAGKTGKFMSCSLPNSASSSPRFTTKHKKKYRNDPPPAHPHYQNERVSPLVRQQSVALTNLERLRESHLRRSKSCGEGRACRPSVDFDIWTASTNNRKDNNRNHEPAAGGRLDEEEKAIMFGQEGQLRRHDEDKFKCGACLFLPGFGKGKAMKARSVPEPNIGISLRLSNIDMVSQRVSLERFECGSWRSSAIISYHEEEDNKNGGSAADTTSSNLFFDLPVELIRCSSINDTESPVTTGFMFDQQQQQQHHSRPKGVLKYTATNNMVASSGGAGRKSHDSSHSNSPRRHVRFSTSSLTTATCNPPRPLQNASDDLNALLEAQSA